MTEFFKFSSKWPIFSSAPFAGGAAASAGCDDLKAAPEMKVNIKADTLLGGTERSGTFDAMHQPAADTRPRW